MRTRRAWKLVVSAMFLCSSLLMTSCITLRVKEASDWSAAEQEEVESTAVFDQYDPVDPASVISAADEADVAEADSTFVEEDEERGGELGASAEKETYSSSETGQTDNSEMSKSVIQEQNREQNEGELDP